MKPTAIIYTSNTGHTERYAKMLGEKINLPVYELEKLGKLQAETNIIFMGWLFASSVKGYKKAAKKFNISAVVGVGLGDTGSQTEAVRKAITLPEDIPLFTVQGGMNHSKLKGINKFAINMLCKNLNSKDDRTEDETKMLEMLKAGGDFVSEDNLAEIIAWYNSIN